jgi:hypothetical protein
MLTRLGTLAITLVLAGALAPSALAATRPARTCHVPSGEGVAFRKGAALVTSNSIPGKSKSKVTFYGCLRGVGKIFVIDRGSSAASAAGTSVGPENFAIAGNYLSFVQVSSSGASTLAKMSIEQWNLKTGKRTLNPNTVSGVTYQTVAAPPKFTASSRGYLAWAITTGLETDPTGLGSVDTLTNLMVFDGHAAAVVDSFNSQTDVAPPGTILSGIFTGLSISGKALSYSRLGQPKTATIG